MRSMSLIFVFLISVQLFACGASTSDTRLPGTNAIVERDVVSPVVGYNASIPSYETPGKFDTPITQKMIDALPVGALRFPGGTIANYFDWHTLGVRADWLLSDDRSRIVAAWEKHASTAGRQVELDVESYWELVRHRNILPFIVLNLYRGDVEANRRAVDIVRKVIPDDVSIRWELGNELSYFDYHRQGFTVDAYIRVARPTAMYIREKYPGDLIGVVGGEYVEGKVLARGEGRRAQALAGRWNQALSRHSWYDAVIFHPYLVAHTAQSWMAKRPDVREAELPSARAKWLTAKALELPPAYQKIHSQYFSDRGVWLTEIGYLNLEGGESRTQDDLHYISILYAAYYLSWLIAGPPVDVYLFHTLMHGESQLGFAPLDRNLSLSFLGVSQLMLGHFSARMGTPLRVRRDGKLWLATREEIARQYRLIINTGTDTAEVTLPFFQDRCSGYMYDRSHASRIRDRKIRELEDLATKFPDCRTVSVSPHSIVLIEGPL